MDSALIVIMRLDLNEPKKQCLDHIFLASARVAGKHWIGVKSDV